jgi:hypothetical protein
MPPRPVWKIRPSGVVPYRLMWARSSVTRSGGIGMVRVSWAARCFRPRLLAGGAVVGPRAARAGGGGGQVDPPPPVLRQVQVGLAEHDRLRGAQRRVVQAGEKSFQVLPPVAESADGSQEIPGLGGADDDAAVDPLGDGGGGPLDAVDRVGGQVAMLDGVAERVVEH